jgi:hypothetical protein
MEKAREKLLGDARVWKRSAGDSGSIRLPAPPTPGPEDPGYDGDEKPAEAGSNSGREGSGASFRRLFV